MCSNISPLQCRYIAVDTDIKKPELRNELSREQWLFVLFCVDIPFHSRSRDLPNFVTVVFVSALLLCFILARTFFHRLYSVFLICYFDVACAFVICY